MKQLMALCCVCCVVLLTVHCGATPVAPTPTPTAASPTPAEPSFVTAAALATCSAPPGAPGALEMYVNVAQPFILGRPAAFAIVLIAASVARVTFDFGDGEPLVNVAGLSTTHTYRRTGTFVATIVAVDNLGRTATKVVPVTVVVDPADPIFLFLSAWHVYPNVTRFLAAVAPSYESIASYHWDFGDGDGGVSEVTATGNATHVYSTTATGSWVTVRVTAITVDGRKVSNSIQIIVCNATLTGACK